MENIKEETESSLLQELEELARKFEQDIIRGSFSYEELVECFHQYMPKILKYGPLNLYWNELSKFIRKHLGEKVPGGIADEFAVYENEPSFQSDMQEIRDVCKSLLDAGVQLSKEQLDELEKIALVESEYSVEFLRYLLGQIIEENYKPRSSTKRLLKEYRAAVSGTNEIACPRIYVETSDVTREFGNKTVAALYELYYTAWSHVQQDEAYNDPSIISIIKTDDYLRKSYGESYYDINNGDNRYSADADCHLNATLLLSDFLQSACPNTFRQSKEWLQERAGYYTDKLWDRTRYHNGYHDIDDLFEQALAANGDRRETVLGSEDKSKVFQKDMII